MMQLIERLKKYLVLGRKKRTMLSIILIMLIVGSYTVVQLIEIRYQIKLRSALDSVLKTTNEALNVWSNEHRLAIQNLVKTKTVVEMTEKLLDESSTYESLKKSDAQKKLREEFFKYLESGQYRGYFIISPDNINISSSRDTNLGAQNLLRESPEVLAKLWEGRTVYSKIQRSDVLMNDINEPNRQKGNMTYFIGAPIKDKGGQVIALLTLRIDPYETFFPLLLGRLGTTGETYAFDEQGVMLSESRFTQDLVKIGLLASGQSNIANIRLLDPGINLIEESIGNLPTSNGSLTTMAENAIRTKADGYNIEGYRDYRGVQVIGSWTWNHSLEIGLTTEQDVAEAYDLFYFVSYLVYFGSFSAGIIFVIAVITFTQGELLLREVRNRLEAVVNTANDAIVVINQKGLIESVNPAFEKMFGYLTQDIIGNNVNVLMPEPYHSEHDAYLDNYHKTNKANIIGVGREVIGKRADGSTFPAELDVNRLELESELHFAGIIKDITQRKEAEFELQYEKDIAENANKMLRLTQQALERTGIAEFWVAAQDGQIIRVNEQACRHLGHSHDELLQLKVPDFDANYTENTFGQLIAPIKQKGWGRFESTHQKKNGQYVPVEVTAMYLAQKDHPDMLITFAMDISERKLAEKALRDSKERLEAAASAGIVGIWDWDVVNNRLIWDKVMYQLYGIDTAQFEGSYEAWSTRIHPDDKEQADAKIVATLRGERDYEHEFRVIWPNASVHHLKAAAHTFYDEQGVPTRMIGINYDLTKQKRIESDLHNARIEAENANRAKSSFLATMSHEIRTPLNGVVGTMDMLAHSKLDEKQLNLVNTAQDSAALLQAIIDDILDFSKIEAGKLELEKVSLFMEPLLEKLGENLCHIAKKEDVELLLFCDPNLPNVYGDPVRLRQILYNLSGNAIKFSARQADKQGRVVVSITQYEQSKNNLFIRLKIKDNGIGMTEEVQKRLFKPFVQGDEETTRRFGGTGLGLIITKRLVELMGGNIELKSEKGVGSTFSVYLPLKLGQDSSSEEMSNLKQLRILLIESEDEIAWIVERYLQHAGAEVIRLKTSEVTAHYIETIKSNLQPVVMLDMQNAKEDFVSLRHELQAELQDEQLRYVVLERGRRRFPRVQEQEDSVYLDINAMSRKILLNAVAAVVGRESPVHDLSHSKTPELTAFAISETVGKVSGQHILLADDNETNQKVISQQLNMLGYSVDVAKNGLEALSMYQQGDYDLLLTDCHMPEMDGYKLSQSIRAIETNGVRIPIIAITADAMKGTAQKCYDAEMDTYLTKPMQLKDLKVALVQLLSIQSSNLPETTSSKNLSNKTSPQNTAAVLEKSELSSHKPAIEANVLGKLIGIQDPLVLADFYNDFLQDNITTVAEIQSTYNAGDIERVSELAHKLKSSARTVGANHLADFCYELEMLGKEGDNVLSAERLSHFVTLFENVKQWVASYVKSVE